MENYLPDPPEDCYWQVLPDRENLSVSLGLHRTNGGYTYAVLSERYIPGLDDPDQLKEDLRKKAYKLLYQYKKLVAIESVSGTFYRS